MILEIMEYVLRMHFFYKVLLLILVIWVIRRVGRCRLARAKRELYTLKYLAGSERLVNGGSKMWNEQESFGEEVKQNWGKLLIAGVLGYLLGNKGGLKKLKTIFANLTKEDTSDVVKKKK